MSQNIEIEFKNMLSKNEFEQLIIFFHLKKENFKKQVNHYFDTPTFLLKSHSSALRIREKSGKYEMTLKQPAKEGLLETNQTISTNDAELMMSNGTIFEGPVKEMIEAMKIPINEIHYFGSLTTERAEIEYKNGLVVLDHSYYLNSEDYEIEYEVSDFQLGKKAFEQLLTELNIPIRKTANKIQRFYDQKKLTN